MFESGFCFRCLSPTFFEGFSRSLALRLIRRCAKGMRRSFNSHQSYIWMPTVAPGYCVRSQSRICFLKFSWHFAIIILFSLLIKCEKSMSQPFWLNVNVTFEDQMLEPVFCVHSLSPKLYEWFSWTRLKCLVQWGTEGINHFN